MKRVGWSMSMRRRVGWLVLLGGCGVVLGWGGWVAAQATKPAQPAGPWWSRPLKVPTCLWMSFEPLYRLPPGKLLHPELGVVVERESGDRLRVRLTYEGYACQFMGRESDDGKTILLEGNQRCQQQVKAADFCALDTDRCNQGLEGLRCEREQQAGHLGMATAELRRTGNQLWQDEGQVHIRLFASLDGCVLAHQTPFSPVSVQGGLVEVGDCQELAAAHRAARSDAGASPRR